MSAAEFPGDEVSEVASFELKYYSPEQIADWLIWPIVDHLWGGDWRQEATPGSVFKFPKSASHDGSMISVELAADCMLEQEEGRYQLDEPAVHEVELEIAVTEAEVIRDLLFSNIPSDQWESVMEGVDQDSLTALRCTTFYFTDQDSELTYSDIDEARVLQDPNGDAKWILDLREDTDDTDFPELKFREYDLDALAFAMRLLTGKHSYDAVVEDIKKHPLTTH